MTPQLEHIRREVERVTCDFTPEDWQRAPQGQWSSAFILEHLLLSYTGTTRGLLKAMERGQPLGGMPKLVDRLKTLVVTRTGWMPSGRTAPKQTTPRGSLGPREVRKFYDGLVAMDACLSDAERRFGGKVKVLDHPLLGPLTVDEWRRFHHTHAMHHLKQIRKVARSVATTAAARRAAG